MKMFISGEFVDLEKFHGFYWKGFKISKKFYIRGLANFFTKLSEK